MYRAWGYISRGVTRVDLNMMLVHRYIGTYLDPYIVGYNYGKRGMPGSRFQRFLRRPHVCFHIRTTSIGPNVGPYPGGPEACMN